MQRGTKVKWTQGINNDIPGSGITISDEEAGHILVAVDAAANMPHAVIWCAITWLTVEA